MHMLVVSQAKCTYPRSCKSWSYGHSPRVVLTFILHTGAIFWSSTPLPPILVASMCELSVICG